MDPICDPNCPRIHTIQGLQCKRISYIPDLVRNFRRILGFPFKGWHDTAVKTLLSLNLNHSFDRFLIRGQNCTSRSTERHIISSFKFWWIDIFCNMCAQSQTVIRRVLLDDNFVLLPPFWVFWPRKILFLLFFTIHIYSVFCLFNSWLLRHQESL